LRSKHHSTELLQLPVTLGLPTSRIVFQKPTTISSQFCPIARSPQWTQASHEHTRPQPLSGCSHRIGIIDQSSATNARRSHRQ